MIFTEEYPFSIPPELNSTEARLYDVTVVGAGPVGLTLALALAKLGVSVVLLEERNQISEGSRAICFAKKSLEIFHKLGVAAPMMAKGVEWNVGRIFFKEKEIDRFDLSPDKIAKFPAFINLQQYYVEHFLIQAAQKEKNIDLRWLHKVTGFDQQPNHVVLQVDTQAGGYALKSQFVVAADGSRSRIRNLMGLEMIGDRFEEQFLIADIKMEADFPSERWFWFDPPFAPGQSILLHKQPDNIWRVDFKLGIHADLKRAQEKTHLVEKIKHIVGNRNFEIDWCSVYRFSSKKLARFVHNNIIFVGDSAHVVSPFGARGANSGIEDADNLSWKLATILQGHTQELLEVYNTERTEAAEQNIALTGQSNTFIAPPSPEALAIRDAILTKAQENETYKRQINCGRLSVPSVYGQYPQSQEGTWKNQDLEPGKSFVDCPIDSGYLIEKLGYHFTLLTPNARLGKEEKEQLWALNIQVLEINIDKNEVFATRYDLMDTGVYLLTPDQYVLGRWRNFTIDRIASITDAFLAGRRYEVTCRTKTTQEAIDEEVAQKLRLAHCL